MERTYRKLKKAFFYKSCWQLKENKLHISCLAAEAQRPALQDNYNTKFSGVGSEVLFCNA